MITNGRTTEAECQTLLQCFPHILARDELASVRSDVASQTLVSLTPQSSNSVLYQPLSYTRPEEIQRDAIRTRVLPRRKRLQFILPADHIDSMRVSLEDLQNSEADDDFIDSDRHDSIDPEDPGAELAALIAESEQQSATQAAQATEIQAVQPSGTEATQVIETQNAQRTSTETTQVIETQATTNSEDPCEILGELIAESEQEKNKRKDEVAGSSKQNSEHSDSTEPKQRLDLPKPADKPENSEDPGEVLERLITEREQEKKKRKDEVAESSKQISEISDSTESEERVQHSELLKSADKTLSTEDPCEVFEGVIAESEQEKKKRLATEKESAKKKEVAHKRRDSKELDDPGSRVDIDQEKRKEVSQKGQRGSVDQTSLNPHTKRRDSKELEEKRKETSSNRRRSHDSAGGSIDHTDQPILSILKYPADADLIRKKRRRVRTDDAECQTQLMVAPHILRPSQAAVVSCDLSVQTSVTCHPDSSVTDVIPQLRLCLVHEGRQATPTTGDNKNNTSVLDLLKGLINDVEYSHMHMFDSCYRPPTVPPELACLEPTVVERTEPIITAPPEPRIVNLIDCNEIQTNREHELVCTSVHSEINTECSTINRPIKIEPIVSETHVVQPRINTESCDIPCRIKIERIDSEFPAIRLDIKTEPSNIPCIIKIERTHSVCADFQVEINSDPCDILRTIKTEPIESEVTAIQRVIKTEPIECELTAIPRVIKTEPIEPNTESRTDSVIVEPDTSDSDVEFQDQWTQTKIIAQVDLTQIEEETPTPSCVISESAAIVVDSLEKHPETESMPVLHSVARLTTVPTATQISTVPSGAKTTASSHAKTSTVPSVIQTPTASSAAKISTVPSATKTSTAPSVTKALIAPSVTETPTARYAGKELTVPVTVKPLEAPNYNINFYLNNFTAQSSDANEGTMKASFQFNVFPPNEKQQPFTTVCEASNAGKVNMQEITLTCNTDGITHEIFNSNIPVKKQSQNLNVVKRSCANMINRVPSRSKTELGAKPCECGPIHFQQAQKGSDKKQAESDPNQLLEHPSVRITVPHQKSSEFCIANETDEDRVTVEEQVFSDALSCVCKQKSYTTTCVFKPTLSTASHKNPYRCRCSEPLEWLDDESECEIRIFTKPSQQEEEYLTNVCDNVALQNCAYGIAPQINPVERAPLKSILSKKDLTTEKKSKHGVSAKSSKNYVNQSSRTDFTEPMQRLDLSDKALSTENAEDPCEVLEGLIAESEEERKKKLVTEKESARKKEVSQKRGDSKEPEYPNSRTDNADFGEPVVTFEETETEKNINSTTITTTTNSVVITGQDASAVHISSPNIVETRITGAKPSYADCREDSAPMIVECKVSTPGKITSTTTSVIITDKGRSLVEVSSPNVIEGTESKSQEITTTTTSVVMTDKGPSVVQFSTANVAEIPQSDTSVVLQQRLAPQTVENKITITESSRAPGATLRPDLSSTGKSPVKISSVRAVTSAKPSNISITPRLKSQIYTPAVLSCDCKKRITNVDTTDDKLMYNNSCALCYVESYATEGYGPTLCKEKDQSSLQDSEIAVSRVDMQVPQVKTRKPEEDAKAKKLHKALSSVKQAMASKVSLTCINDEPYIRELVKEFPGQERSKLTCISDAEISWSNILLPSDVKIQAIDKSVPIKDVTEEEEMKEIMGEVLSSKSLPCICKSGYVLPVRVHRNIDLLCSNPESSLCEVACRESISTIVILLPRSRHYLSTTTFPIEPETPTSLARISKEMFRKPEVEDSLIDQRLAPVESKKSVTFEMNTSRIVPCKNYSKISTSKSAHVCCCKNTPPSKLTTKHKELPTMPVIKKQPTKLHGPVKLTKPKSHEKMLSPSSRMSPVSTSKLSTPYTSKLFTTKPSTISISKPAKLSSRTTITIKQAKVTYDPGDTPLQMKLPQSTASEKIKPDPVFMAMATCQTEFQPIKQALHTVQEKLKNLHMPELDSIFNRVPAYKDTLQSDAKETFKISVAYKLDPTNQPAFEYNSLNSNGMNNQYKSFGANESRNVPPTVAYPRTTTAFTTYPGKPHQERDVYNASVPSAQDPSQNYYSLPDSEWRDYINTFDFQSPPPKTLSTKFSMHKPPESDRIYKDRFKPKHASSRIDFAEDYTYIPSVSEKRERKKKDRPKDNYRGSSRTNFDTDFRESEKPGRNKRHRSRHVIYNQDYAEVFRRMPSNTHVRDKCTCSHDRSSNDRDDYRRHEDYSQGASNPEDRCYCNKPHKSVSKIRMKKKHRNSRSKTNIKRSDSQCPFLDVLKALFIPAEQYGKAPRLTSKDIENLRVHMRFHSKHDKRKHS